MAEEKIDTQKYMDLLNQKGAIQPCPRCGKKLFSLQEGYSYFPIDEKVGTVLGTRIIPAILVICSNCGAIIPHALGIFENIKDEENGKK